MLKLQKLIHPGTQTNSYPSPQQNRKIDDDASDVKLANSKDFKEQSAKRLVQKNKIITKTQGEDIYYYKKLTSGRRCSCFIGYSTPEGKCPICFKTGIVGGYSKYGTNTNIFDATAPNYSMVGVKLTYDTQLRPLNFELVEGAKFGEIYFTFDILQTNTGVLDVMQFLYSRTNKNAQVKLYVKKQTETSYIIATNEIIEGLLGEEFLDFKIRITRAHTRINSPIISHLFLRYNIKESLILEADIASHEESMQLDELGYYANFTTVQSFWDNRLVTMNSQDFLYRVKRNQRWKPINSTDRKNVDITTNFEVTLRLIQNFEPYYSFPI